MIRHNACIQFLWTDRPLPERARAAAANGFDGVDLWDWRGVDIDAIHAACAAGGIAIGSFFGHSTGGLRDPSHRGKLLDGIAESIEVAQRVGATGLSLFSDEIHRPHGIIAKPPPIPAVAQYFSCLDGIAAALELVEGTDLMLVIEAINTVNVPGYFWDEAGVTIQLCREINHPQLRLAFDCFHQQLVGGRLTDTLIAALPWAARVDVANVPGRHQPGIGEIDFTHIRGVLDAHGFDGTITFETVPHAGDDDACVRAVRACFGF